MACPHHPDRPEFGCDHCIAYARQRPTPFDPGLSADQRRTQRRAELLAAGIHPRTRQPLFIGTGETCGTCTHHFAHTRNKTYHKCDIGGASHGAATDIRTSWPACNLYQRQKDDQ